MPAANQPSKEAKIAALVTQLGVSSQPNNDDVKKKEGETQKTSKGEKQRLSCDDSSGI